VLGIGVSAILMVVAATAISRRHRQRLACAAQDQLDAHLDDATADALTERAEPRGTCLRITRDPLRAENPTRRSRVPTEGARTSRAPP
jgi:hypothetical protein